MIIYHHTRVAAFTGAHRFFWVGQPLFGFRIAVTTAAPANEEIEQARAMFRFVGSRVFGRVN